MERNTLAFLFLMALFDHAVEGEKLAKIVTWGTDRDVYHAGDTPVAFIEIKNTSDHVIEHAIVKLTVTRRMLFGETFTLLNDKAFKARDFFPDLHIPPGNKERFEVSTCRIPDSSVVKGTYTIKAEIIVEDHPVGLIFWEFRVE